MIFVYIFLVALAGIGILLFVAYRHPQIASKNDLQNDDYWYTIDLVALQKYLYTRFHVISRPLFRSLLHKLLEVYLRMVTGIRKILRRHINALLDHYAKEHDNLYHTKPSKFIAEIQAHKNMADGTQKDLSSLDEYSQ
ncbi:MAG: hypothetical protein KBC22_01605 [Candidatus Pacebacteria bacterium]|nr:hypothetical protein [Candidatus Paceibacterota bacterium]